MNFARDRKAAIVWFRRDLRLTDNLALRMALESGGPLVPFFSLDTEGETAPAAIPSRAWIRRSLGSLEESLRCRGSRLVIRQGVAGKALSDLANDPGLWLRISALRTAPPAATDRRWPSRSCPRGRFRG